MSLYINYFLRGYGNNHIKSMTSKLSAFSLLRLPIPGLGLKAPIKFFDFQGVHTLSASAYTGVSVLACERTLWVMCICVVVYGAV